MENRYSTLSTIAGILFIVSILILVLCLGTFVFQLFIVDHTDFNILIIVVGGMFMSIVIMAFSKFIDMAIDVANHITKE